MQAQKGTPALKCVYMNMDKHTDYTNLYLNKSVAQNRERERGTDRHKKKRRIEREEKAGRVRDGHTIEQQKKRQS